tara:strand:+ start:118 stop:1323 length:1206 start_codon:yes stop_codon:yes gene_type:complete
MSLKLSAGCKCCDVTPPITDLCICGDVVQMVLIFQDEAQSVYSPSGTTAWDADVSDWEDKVAIFDAPEYAQLCQVWVYGATVAPNEATSVCKPSTRDMPDGWTWDDLVRSPTEAEVKAVYDSAKGGEFVDDPTDLVLLGVDVSGSMNLGTLGDGYSDFKDYLDSIGVLWKQVLFTNERWVQLTTDNYVDTLEGETPAEVDITLDGLVNGADCDICEELVGTFTLTDPIQITSGFDFDGWYPIDWGTDSADAARYLDVPDSTTHACVWKYEANEHCAWDYTTGTPPTEDLIDKEGRFWGFLLARFRISSTEYIWRLIVLYELYMSCSGDYIPSDERRVNSGWYWEYENDTPSCTLTGSESWTSNFPDDAPLMWVDCNQMEEAYFSDWCDYDLTLTNVETVIP